MNRLLRTCKHHWAEGENHHWGYVQDRRPFAPLGTPPRFAPDAAVTGRHLRLELHLDVPAERAWGTTTHTLEVLAEETRQVRFDAIGLTVSRVQVNGRAAGYDNDGEAVTVRLPRRFTRGQSLEIALSHEVTRPTAGLYFTNPDEAYPQRFRTAWSQGQDEDSRYYFPCLDAPRFKQSSEALLYVPAGWFALSNGELVAHTPTSAKGRAGKRSATKSKDSAAAGSAEDLWHYRMELPYSTYLFSVVAGEFAAHHESRHGVDVRWYVEPGREVEGRNAFGNTGDILRFFSRFTGVPYPHAQYTQIAVPDFIFGGMENFTVTTQTDLTLHDDRAHQDFSSDNLVSHEAAHSWFGNLVTARNWDHAWLHESFATYMECLWLRESEGDDEHDFQVLGDAEAYFHEDGQYRRPIVTNRYEAPIDLFDAHLYPGGAVRLRHLHALLGDAPFRAALKRYLQTHRLGVVETVDLARALEQETGLNWDWWFDQWIYAAGFPALDVRFTWQETEGLATVTVKQTQPLQEGQPGAAAPAPAAKDARTKGRYFRLPTKLLLRVGTRDEIVPLTLEDQETRIVLRLDKRPSMVLLDPDYECPVKTVTYHKPEDLLLHELEHAPRPVARIEAAAALADKPSHKVTAALGRQLRREPFWGVQQRIARALGKIGGEAARDALLRGLSIDNAKARREVVATLGHFRADPKVAAALTRRARAGDPSYYVEAELARALGRAHAPQARTVLESYLERPSHVEVIRSGAFDGLGHLAEEETLPVLRDGMRYGAPAMSRAAAVRAATELGRTHQHLRKTVLEELGRIAEHQGNPAGAFRGKMAAIRSLTTLGDLEAVPILRRVAAQATDGRIERQARLAADTVRRRAAKPAEMESLRDDVRDILKENKALRDRVDTLEQTHKLPAAKRGKGAGRKRG